MFGARPVWTNLASFETWARLMGVGTVCARDFLLQKAPSRTVLDLVWWQNAHLVAPCLTLGGHFCHQGWAQLD